MNHRNSQGEGEWRQEIVALEAEGCRAFIARDLDRLTETWSDQLLVNSPISRVHDKLQVLELLRAGKIAHHSLEGIIETLERRDDLAVVMGRELVVNSPGGPVIHRRFTNVWRAEADGWRRLSRHANIVPNNGA